MLAGDTLLLLPVTVPTPLSMLKLDAPVTDQLSVELPPVVMVAAVAVKLEMPGAELVGVEAELAVAPLQPEIATRRDNPTQNTRDNTTERRTLYTESLPQPLAALHVFRTMIERTSTKAVQPPKSHGCQGSISARKESSATHLTKDQDRPAPVLMSVSRSPLNSCHRQTQMLDAIPCAVVNGGM